MGYLYMLKNKTNRKIYIGQTNRPIKERLKEHETGKSSGCVAIYNAIQKYGWENFEIDWYACPGEDLNKHEKWMVNLMGTISPGGYNLKEGGGNGKHSEETKQKMRKPRSEETKQKMRKPKSDKHKQNIGKSHIGKNNPMWGKKRSKETIQKHSESMKGKKSHWCGKTGSKHSRSKIIYQYDLDDTFIESFGSTEEASRHLEKNGTHIRACASGRKKTAYKFKWSYTFPYV